jgi:trans-aconitate methyltransferase
MAESSNARKYRTRNPLVRRLTRRFLERIRRRVLDFEPSRIVDLGCGEGFVARHLLTDLPFEVTYRGVDANAQALDEARRMSPGLDFRQGDILDPAPAEPWSELSLCIEVLEHLREPSRAVERIAEWTREVAVISVPWEPYFRLGNLARGRHVRRLGNHPEHLQQFSPRTFRELVAGSFSEVTVETCFPWLLAIARK